MDTDKYEGHTEGAWIALNDNAVKTPKHDDPMAFIERRNDDGDVVSLSKADADLIADAPLLLAEVMRLRERLSIVEDFINDELRAFVNSNTFDRIYDAIEKKLEEMR